MRDGDNPRSRRRVATMRREIILGLDARFTSFAFQHALRAAAEHGLAGVREARYSLLVAIIGVDGRPGFDRDDRTGRESPFSYSRESREPGSRSRAGRAPRRSAFAPPIPARP